MNRAKTGATINDRYTIQSELGRGGMGTVYRAQDETLKRSVALKVIADTNLGTAGRTRLLREAQLVAKLNHPNIVTVFDAGEVHGSPFIVMELVEGRTLAEHPPEDLDQIAAIARQVCQALDHAHQGGIVHRDLKPENILIEPQGGVKLMDFGLARSTASRLTTEGNLTGTVFYMAPEQAMGQAMDGRTDLYALGVLLYELVTGSLPFEADDPVAVISQHLHAPVVPPKAKREDLPRYLNHLILQLMSKDPADRPASAKEVIQMLEEPGGEAENLHDSNDPALLDRIVQGRIIGRQNEVKEARQLWQKTARGEGQLLLISGEPGIGKTRLTREIATHVEVSGGRVMHGAFYSEGSAPYSSFAQIIRKELLNGTRENLPDHIVADMLLIAPDLKPHFERVPPNPKLEPQYEQQRMFENLLSFFTILSEKQPILVVLEDVHWADEGSLLILRHLARNLSNKAVMIAATYREVELDENLPLNHTLGELNRERLGQRIKLRRLTKENTKEMLAAMFAGKITDEFLSLIYDETEGNPFFTEELCKSLVDSGQVYFEDGEWHRPEDAKEIRLPQSIRVAIQARVNRLDEDHLELLRTAAVFGHEFDFDSLKHASRAGEDAIIDALEAAEQSQIIRELNHQFGGTFSFVHALIPATLAESVSNLRQRRMHQHAAEAILAVRPDDFETIAYHFSKGGKPDSARENYIKAGERAHALTAFDDAARYYFLALESWPESDPMGRADTLSLIALMRYYSWTSKAQEEIIDLYEEAKMIYMDLGAPLKAGEVARRIGRVYWISGNREQAMAHYQNAYEILKKEPDSEELAFAMSSLSQIYMLIPDPDNAIQWGEKAIAMAEKLDAEAVIAHVLNNLGASWMHLGKIEKGKAMLIESHERNHAIGNYYEAARALHNLREHLDSIDSPQQRLENVQKEIAYAKQQQMVGFINAAELSLESNLAAFGKWRQALDLLAKLDSQNFLIAISVLWYTRNFGDLYNHLGMYDKALERLEAVYQQALLAAEQQSTVPHLYQICRAKYALGKHEEIKADMEKMFEMLNSVPVIHGNSSIPLRFAAKYYADQKDENKFAITLNLLEKARQNNFNSHESNAALAEAQGYFELSKGNYQEAIAHLKKALANWQASEYVYEQLGTLHLLGKAHLKAGDNKAAKSAYNDAKKIVDQLAGEIDNEEYKHSFLNTPVVKDVLEGVK